MTGAARDAAVRAFLDAHGWGGAALSPLAGDASNRRYLRLSRDGVPAVLMDAPPERGEDVRPFVAMTDWLRGQGLSAPEIYARDLGAGLLLLEDLGDALYARHIAADPRSEADLYGAAVDLLVHMADCPPPPAIGSAGAETPLASYDGAVLLREAALVTDWWLPGATGAAASPDLAAEFGGLIAQATQPVASARDIVVLRDYHAENLFWLPDRPGLGRIGLLDYQDALAGHAAYDLVSVLEDARRDTAPALQEAMLARYLAARPGIDGNAFRHAYAVLGAQRNLKIVGIFARLALRDGKPAYAGLIPRVWRHLQRDLAHPALAPLAAFVRRHVPEPDAAARARLVAKVPA